jgi:hypothetical protein
MKYNIRFKFADDARYEIVENENTEHLKVGHYMEPFASSSLERILVDVFSQDHVGRVLTKDHGEVVALEISEAGDELDQLRQTNSTLRWHVRTLSREQANCDMMSVDFPAFEKRVKAISDTVPTDNLLALIHDQWAALEEAKAAYQAFDNSYNFFKNGLAVALEGSPEMSDDEDDLANNTWVGMVEKLMEAWVQSKTNLNEALGFMEALYSQQAMPDDSLNPLVDAFLKAHPYKEPTDAKS